VARPQMSACANCVSPYRVSGLNGFRRASTLARAALSAQLSKTDRFGQYRPRRGVIWRDHRIVGGKLPFRAILIRQTRFWLWSFRHVQPGFGYSSITRSNNLSTRSSTAFAKRAQETPPSVAPYPTRGGKLAGDVVDDRQPSLSEPTSYASYYHSQNWGEGSSKDKKERNVENGEDTFGSSRRRKYGGLMASSRGRPP
jgi:hypothetical protein